MEIAPIVLFVYNRPWHTQQTIEALQKNELAHESELFVYSDAAKNSKTQKQVDEVRKYINNIAGFKKITVTEQVKNCGLANSIIAGVTTVVNKYGRVIVLEDDLVTSPCFLKYMNDALDFYKDEQDVVSIHGYIYPLENTNDLPETFFIKGADCWGWATWQRGWILFEENGKKLLKELQLKKLEKEADFNGKYGFTKMLKNQISHKNDSWAIRWYMSTFLQRKLTLYPKKSLVRNIGNDGSGTHSSKSDCYHIENLEFIFPSLNKKICEHVIAKERIGDYLAKSTTFFKRLSTYIQQKI